MATKIKGKVIGDRWFDLLNLDLLGIPRNISDMSVSLRSIHYKLSNLGNLKYLDLADSKVRRIKIEKPVDSLFDEHHCQRLVAHELIRNRKKLNAELFQLYNESFEYNRLYVDGAEMLKYLKVFNFFQTYKTFGSSRRITSSLMKTASDNNVLCPIFVRAMFDHLFTNARTVGCLIAYPDITKSFVHVISGLEKNEMFQLLLGIFEIHNICPVLGSIFYENRYFLKQLTQMWIKKTEFRFNLVIFPRRLMTDPLYSKFQPIHSTGKVRLNPEIFDIRDHYLFEIVVIIWMRHNCFTDKDLVRYGLYVISKTQAYPYMSVAELQTRVKKIAPSLSDAYLRKLVKSYKTYFPEAPAETCPRSLKELCRCTIRDSLNKESASYQSLQIPEKFKHYLDCQGHE